VSAPQLPTLFTAFEQLDDPRDPRPRVHPLRNILVLAFVAVLGGADSWRAIQRFGNAKRDWFARFLDLSGGIPSHDTFGRVFAVLDPPAFAAAWQRWIADWAAALDFRHLAIDGKAVRGAVDQARSLGCLHTVSVFANEYGLTLAQHAVDGKSNEITAIPELLRVLDLKGALVSIDAMGCQKEIAEQIVERKGDYLLALKENQPTLFRQVEELFGKALDEDFRGRQSYAVCSTSEKGHGREELRVYQVLRDVKDLPVAAEWRDLRCVVMVTRETVRGGKRSLETSYYISSSAASIDELARGIRSHWGIENRCHWILDVGFGEDANTTRLGHAAENLAWLNRMVLSVLRMDESKDALKGKRQRAGWDNDYLEHLLHLMSQM
jgi:predicted transposase YbfD/YdcC